MKQKIILSALLLALIGCGKQSQKDIYRPLRLTDDIVLKTTPVKNQGSSPLCWVYAMLATIETEHLQQGDSVHLSPDYVARMYLTEQATHRLYTQGGKSDRPITMRGMPGMLINLIETYGLQHFDAYHRPDDADYNMLCRRIEKSLSTPAKDSPQSRLADISLLLDKGLGYPPRQVFMLGAVYTPLEFAHSVCRSDEYEALTSFTHHPFGQRFALEVPDNYYHNTFLNVPIDTMMARIVRALRQGHPVCWEGDISEPGFSFEHGTATLHNEKEKVSQKHRQYSFEAHKTTDDHCMEITGLAHDSRGRLFFRCKNSWGNDNPYNGFMYLSENYIRLKTIAVFLPAE
ncbi:C1 family peptidase [Prevotella dentasini]|uniref:C1 family peptidase n=1 Tax=Prevotella dentasini TaxID=589537 RepID=UPI00046ADCEA|nr:C1 family peptidase [Prevotella dentasini]